MFKRCVFNGDLEVGEYPEGGSEAEAPATGYQV